MPTVLHVSQPTDYGVARTIPALAQAQRDRGWDVIVASPAGGTLASDARDAGATWHLWTATRQPGRGIVSEVAGLRALVASVRPALVHLHSSKAGLAGRLALRGTVPTLFQPHGWSFLALAAPARPAVVRWERLAARWTERIICCSSDEMATGKAAGIAAQWAVVPNSIDLDAWPRVDAAARDEARHRLGMTGPAVVCIGRLAPQKGQDVLVDAWPEVSALVPDAQLYLVGDGPDHEALARRSGWSVHLLGRRDDIHDWVAAADVVAHPSRYEGLSLSLLEAMATGRSVVASDVEGMAEVIGEDAGAVVPAEDARALAAAIVARLQDPELAAREGAAGRRRVEAHHDLRRWQERMADLSSEAMAPRREGRCAS